MANTVHFRPDFPQTILTTYSNDPRGRVDIETRCREIEDVSRRVAPVRPSRPGRPATAKLKASFSHHLERQGFFVKGVVSNLAPYSLFVHNGARPHQIHPQFGGRLKFFWESPGPGKWVHPWFVSHPGIPKSSTTPFFFIAAKQLGYTLSVSR